MRKLTLIAITALAAMALTTTAQAEAQIGVVYPTGDPCGEIVVDGGNVSGGCVIDTGLGYHGNNVGFSVGYPLNYSNQCDSTFELHIDDVGNLAAANADVEWGGLCGVRECDTGSATDVWTGSLQAHEDGADTAEIHLDMCLEQWNNSSDTKRIVPLTGTFRSGSLHDETTIETTANAMTFVSMEGDWWANWESTDKVSIFLY